MRGDRKQKMFVERTRQRIHHDNATEISPQKHKRLLFLVLNGGEIHICVYLLMHYLNNSPLTKVLYILKTTYKENQP